MDTLVTGKLPAALLAELLRSARRDADELRIGPAVGEDACAIDLEAGTLVAATDPITLVDSGVGAHAVAVNANDVAVMGVRPRWFLAVVMVPPGTTPEALRRLFTEMQQALDRIGAVLVGGHTELTDAVRQPLVIGQMLGHRTDGRVISTGGARPGDVVLQVGPAPVEGAAVLARQRPDALGRLDPTLREAALRALDDPGISVVEPALLAADLGATALHDPTEGGLATGLHELAEASGTALEVDESEIPWFEAGRALCDAVGADPWRTLASGALLAAFAEEDAERARVAFDDRGLRVGAIARVGRGDGVTTSRGQRVPHTERDEIARVLDEG